MRTISVCITRRGFCTLVHSFYYSNALLGGTSAGNTPPLLTTELAGGGVSLQVGTDMPFSTLCSNTDAACSTNITGRESPAPEDQARAVETPGASSLLLIN